jgi:hypothetical protein
MRFDCISNRGKENRKPMSNGDVDKERKRNVQIQKKLMDQ